MNADNRYFYGVPGAWRWPALDHTNPKTMRLQPLFPIGAAASFLLIACSQPCPPPPEHYSHPVFSIPEETDANIAAVDNYLHAMIKADAEAIRASVGPGFYSNNTWLPADSTDVEGVIMRWQRNDSTRADQKLKKTFAQCIRVAEGNDYPGDWVQYWGDYSATDKESGKPFTVKFLADAQVKDGKLVKIYTHFDRLSVFRQLGKTPPEAEPAK